MRLNPVLAFAAQILCTSIASASVFVVDDNGGPGVDYLDIQPAIDAGAAGDVVIVRPGSYSTFTLTKGISILCDSGAHIYNGSPAIARVLALPAGQRAVVSGLSIHGLEVDACTGPVLLEGLSPNSYPYGATLVVTGSADVRLRACSNVAVFADGSRVEVTNSSLVGQLGLEGCQGSCPHIDGYQGYAGIHAINNAIVHVGVTSVRGGDGGPGGYLSFCTNGNGGSGGSGIVVQSGATVLVTGTGAESISGGQGGLGEPGICGPPGLDGVPGYALEVFGGTFLHSGVVFVGSIFGPTTQVVPPDPSLRLSGTGVAGTPMTYTVYGQPGDEVRLRLGRQLIVQDVPGVYEDRLTLSLRSYNLGFLPASGQATFTLNVPTSLPPNFVVVAQASVTDPGGVARLTQSAPFAVR